MVVLSTGVRILAATALVGGAVLLAACTSRVVDSAILTHGSDPDDSPHLRVVDVKRQTHEGILLGITEEQYAQADTAGDYLVVTFSLENPTTWVDDRLYSSQIAVGWGDRYAGPRIRSENLRIDVARGKSTEFQLTFRLEDVGRAHDLTSPNDLTIFYDEDGFGRFEDAGDIEYARDIAEVSVPLDGLWDGSF